jgi:integrase
MIYLKYEYLDYKYTTYYNETLNLWVSAINMGKDTFGKRKRKVLYGDTEKDVIKKANSIIIDMNNGDYMEPNKDSLICFLKEYHRIRAGCDMWKPNYKMPEDAKWEENTALLNKMYIDVHFEPYFKEIKLTDIKPVTLDKFYNYKLSTPGEYEVMIKGKKVKKERPPLSMNTVIKLDKFLKSSFYYAIKNGMLKNNPTTGVVVLGKKKKYKPTVFNKEQFLKLLQSVEGTDDEIPIILGGGCGLRRGEIFGLKWENVDFDSGTITIENTMIRFKSTKDKDGAKNEQSARTIIIPKYVLDTLNNYKIKISPNDADKIITRWKPGSYSERYGILLDRFDLPHTRLHDLRHYNAVIMMNKGIPDKAAAEFLGHKDTQMLHDVYQHVQEEMKQKTADTINEMFKKKNSHEPREE